MAAKASSCVVARYRLPTGAPPNPSSVTAIEVRPIRRRFDGCPVDPDTGACPAPPLTGRPPTGPQPEAGRAAAAGEVGPGVGAGGRGGEIDPRRGNLARRHQPPMRLAGGQR